MQLYETGLLTPASLQLFSNFCQSSISMGSKEMHSLGGCYAAADRSGDQMQFCFFHKRLMNVPHA